MVILTIIVEQDRRAVITMITLLIIMLSLVLGFLASFISVAVIAATNSGLTSIVKPLVVLTILFSGVAWIAIDAHESVADTASENLVAYENLKGVLDMAEQRRRELTSERSQEKLCLFETPDVTKDIDTVIATINGGDTTVFRLVIFKR